MSNSLRNKKVLITAGPTREYWDPVRFLSNPSSGRMGLALARTLQKKKADVTVVLGPVSSAPPSQVKIVHVVSALQMGKEVRKRIKTADVFIATAAVSDWRFASPSSIKVKKGKKASLTVRMKKNPDILAGAGKWKGKRSRPILVGFSLETSHIPAFAQKKLREKNLDLIVGNAPASFANDKIKPVWIERGQKPIKLGVMSKTKLAMRIASWLITQDPLTHDRRS